ncbi:MAG: hypothetical protein IK015_09385 [Treponema sp.]|nr:hypothetical protein [Treponema sp.]
MKKFLLSAVLALCAATNFGLWAVKPKDFSKQQTTIFVKSVDNQDSGCLYFSKSTGSIPYVDVLTMLNKLNWQDFCSVKKGERHYTIVRNDNGAEVCFNQDQKVITFSDFDLFRKKKDAGTLLDIVDDYYYIVHEPFGFETRGAPIDIHYDTFLIDIAIDKDLCLIPLQTFSDIFASSVFGTFLYNGKDCFFVSSSEALQNDDGDLTELGKKYYEIEPGPMDIDYADFNMRELALNCQLNYGLKDLHGIEKFSDWLAARDLIDPLSSTDSYEVDFAVAEICHRYLGDIHSSFCVHSPRSKRDVKPEEKRDIMISPSLQRIRQSMQEAQQMRASFFPKGVPGVQTIGDTVYVTFDSFWTDNSRDYYKNPITEEEKARVLLDYHSSGIDTRGLINVANQIVQADKNIRNVVVDVSCNLGGQLDAAIFVACWLLGRADLRIKSGITGSQSSTSYMADINFNEKIDDADTVRDRRIFCLVSDITFSCGNILASTLEESGKATLIGSKTGGGACAVLLTSTASGTLFKTSSFYRFSAEKNGAFNAVDDGVSPDYKLTELRSFYNRSDKDGLTAFIRKLY